MAVPPLVALPPVVLPPVVLSLAVLPPVVLSPLVLSPVVLSLVALVVAVPVVVLGLGFWRLRPPGPLVGLCGTGAEVGRRAGSPEGGSGR
ncbi:hypothetical protein DMB42_22500 [Nonomuraea sp. WAC 01424]|uniref:hypothetical protein n=1 Tax=Nonomuraea sp. WAC 01424 TaxID=2203200 RepID=UPI000F7A7AAB|nr:hypothetical protein [Nonomuraea sp. WAC 01424]RSN07430.1 hypothetical protein DMB42_22500 [Nonomuraea sp. WAC 01424]